LKKLGDNAKNSIVFVNYQAEGSPGYYVQRGDAEMKFDNEAVKLKLNRHSIEGFSGHSDQNELVDFIQKIKPRPKKIIVVHGEASRALSLASTYHKTFRVETITPKDLEVIRLR
jgi:hypothetical protein